MRLKRHLEIRQQSVSDFAQAVGVSRQTVYRWISGECLPNSRQMARVIRATEGIVTPNDFFGHGQITSQGGAAA